MHPQPQFIRLPGRLRLEVVEQGRRSALPVIALHGVTDDGGGDAERLSGVGKAERSLWEGLYAPTCSRADVVGA